MKPEKRKHDDILKKRKCIHVQLDVDTHTFFRRELFTVGLTMQEALEAFSRLVASGDHTALKLMQGFVNSKLHDQIKTMKESIRKKEIQSFGELDSDKLYNLINDESTLDLLKDD